MNTTTLKEVEYEQPEGGAVCSTKYAWARVPPEPAPDERERLKARIRRLLKEKNAVMVSHYYVHPDLQDLAEETGGIVSDSLEMGASAATMRRRCWWSAVCASWARRRRS